MTLRITPEMLSRIGDYAARIEGPKQRTIGPTIRKLLERALNDAERKAGIRRGDAGRGGTKRGA